MSHRGRAQRPSSSRRPDNPRPPDPPDRIAASQRVLDDGLARMRQTLADLHSPPAQSSLEETQAFEEFVDQLMPVDGEGVAGSIHAPSRSVSRASKRARTESGDEDSDMQSDEHASHPVLNKFITWLQKHIEANPGEGASIVKGLYTALESIQLSSRDDDTIRRPLPKTQGNPPLGSLTQAPPAPRPPKAPTATPANTPKTFAAVAAKTPKHIPKDDLPKVIRKVEQLRRDFPSITEQDAIRYASQAPAGSTQKNLDATKERRKGSAVVQGTKSNVLLLKPVKPEEINRTPEQVLANVANPLVKELITLLSLTRTPSHTSSFWEYQNYVPMATP
ncbi:hypothetical protein JOM56_015719 [Amanita muscaria]